MVIAIFYKVDFATFRHSTITSSHRGASQHYPE